MRKKIPVILFIALLAGCKKEYECECVTSTTQKGIEPTTETVTTGKIKKSDRKSECNLSDYEYRNGDPTSGNTHLVTRDCSPK